MIHGGMGGDEMRYRSADFQVDGAMRDVCILDAEIQDWQRVLSSLPSLEWVVSFSTTLAEEPANIFENARALFDALGYDREASATLAIQVGGTWFTCYFFEVEEIEFTFDTGDVFDEISFVLLESFMIWLGEACGKRVIMTMEGTDHRSMPALLEYTPV